MRITSWRWNSSHLDALLLILELLKLSLDQLGLRVTAKRTSELESCGEKNHLATCTYLKLIKISLKKHSFKACHVREAR